MEKLVKQEGVLFVGQFHVAFFASHKEDFFFGKIFHHHTAVVRDAEVRVLQREFVGSSDGGESEGLRCLSSLQPRPIRYGEDVVFLRFDDGVHGWHGDVNGGVRQQGFTHVINDSLTHQRSDGIMENEVHLFFPLIGLNRAEAGEISFLSAFENFFNLFPAVS